MKTFRRSLAVVAMLVSVAGFQSAAISAMPSATVSPPTHGVTGCCYVYVSSRWYCFPC